MLCRWSRKYDLLFVSETYVFTLEIINAYLKIIIMKKKTSSIVLIVIGILILFLLHGVLGVKEGTLALDFVALMTIVFGSLSLNSLRTVKC